MYSTGRRNLIQYVLTTYPMSNKLLYDFPTSDIGYPIESARQMAWYKLYITPLLPTGYSFGVGRGQADY
jgi:hypothetical protein